MAKEVKLNLEPTDFSKAKLSLDENENPFSTSIIQLNQEVEQLKIYLNRNK